MAANGDAANKIGTSLLATAAKRYGIPFYVVAPISSIDPDTPTGADIEIEQREIDKSISENGVFMLNHDQARQEAFIYANDFKVNYKQNLAYISNQRIKLSASSEFYLKMAARFALLFASLQVGSMMYPRLMFSDNMEDKGMEPDRAANFQRLVVKRLKDLGNPEYQLIFATSMIAPELDREEYIIGDNYTRENKSLKNV